MESDWYKGMGQYPDTVWMYSIALAGGSVIPHDSHFRAPAHSVVLCICRVEAGGKRCRSVLV